MKGRSAALSSIAMIALVIAAAPADGHIRRYGDADDKPGRFDIKHVAMDHGRSDSCKQRCVEIGIKTYENWSPKLLGGPNSRFRNFYILFGSRGGYDRYLWIWWANDHLVASMKDFNGTYFTEMEGRFIGAAAVAKEGDNLAVRFPKRLLKRTRGNPYDDTDKVWWQVVSEYKGKGCRPACLDFGPGRPQLHRF